MVSVKTLHNEVRLMLNRLNTNYDSDINVVDIDSNLNYAKHLLLSSYDKYIEKNRTYTRVLYSNINYNKSLNKSNNDSKLFTIFDLPEDYYDYTNINGSISSVKGKCKNKKLETIINVQQNDLNEALKDTYKQPNFLWRRTLFHFADNKIIFYKNKDFEFNDINISYLKWIKDVAAPSLTQNKSYIKSDGSKVVKDVNLNISEKSIFWRKMVQITAYLIKKQLDDNFTLDINSIMFNENVGII